MPSKLPKKSRARTGYVGTAYGAGYLNNLCNFGIGSCEYIPLGGGGEYSHIYIPVLLVKRVERLNIQ